MYETTPPRSYNSEDALQAYTDFLSNLERFKAAMRKVMIEWPISCEQFLTNQNVNRIAWLGQSAMCIATGVPRCFKAGFAGLSNPTKLAANALASRYLKAWEKEYGDDQNSEVEEPAPIGLRPRIAHYIRAWTAKGYKNGIPDEVPSELMRLNLAPSQKAIALAILKNDHSLSSLGYSQPVSPWYSVIKQVELRARAVNDPAFT